MTTLQEFQQQASNTRLASYPSVSKPIPRLP